MGELKNSLNKAVDTAAGVGGRMSASATTSADRFVENAAIGDLYEIEAARRALQRSRDERVRRIADKMISDHRTSTHQLRSALEMNEARGVAAPPSTPDERRKTMLQHLDEAPDDSFDKTYLDQQVLAHEETASLMRSYADDGDNAQLRSYAFGTLPVVERHLEKVKQVRGAL